ncbi:MAG: response regulator [Chloroflexi bacterium]|nr:response regulator [Chloroflexota bacterium]
MRILYVEDNLLNLCLVERIARLGQHEVINYSYAEMALRNFDRDRPDLVLVDLRLEGNMTGIDLIGQLRATHHTQPVVVITAAADDDIRKECFDAGCDEYFIKPLPVRELVRILQRYVDELSPTARRLATQEMAPIAFSPQEPPSAKL